MTWDTIIIGSGLGGMTTGTLLAMAGQKVLILERHTAPGGFTHTFKRKGYEWDVGVHYVGQVANEKSIPRKVFDYVTEGTLKWAPMDKVYDRVLIDGHQYDYVAGSEEQIAALAREFPGEEEAIREYMALIKSTAAKGAWFFGEKTMPFWMSRLVGRFLRRPFETWAARHTADVVKSITSNERLRAVLCAQCGDYGLEPERSSFAIHAVVAEHYINGASYPVGGAGEISKRILATFTKFGGELRLRADVKQVAIENGRAVGVELADGSVLRAKNVVSNAGYANTFGKLTGHEASPIPPSTAHLCLYVGLDESDEALNLPKHNIWVYPSANFQSSIEKFKLDTNQEFPVVYISFPSAKDPKRGAKATIQVIAPYPYEEMKKWQETKWSRRPEDYGDLKARMSHRLTDALIKAVPQIAGHIAYSELSTPLSTKHFAGYSNGEIYGLEHTPERFALKSLRPQTKVPGLFLTGQDIVTVGVAGALYSGVLTATVILKKSVIMRIMFGLTLGKRRPRPA